MSKIHFYQIIPPKQKGCRNNNNYYTDLQPAINNNKTLKQPAKKQKTKYTKIYFSSSTPSYIYILISI